MSTSVGVGLQSNGQYTFNCMELELCNAYELLLVKEISGGNRKIVEGTSQKIGGNLKHWCLKVSFLAVVFLHVIIYLQVK